LLIFMSSAAPTEFFYGLSGQERPFFWIRPVDEDGFPVDRQFAEAAYQKTRDLRLYRARELPDAAVRADLVERAVRAASRAEKTEPVRDAKSYVFATFVRLVDERIERERTVENVQPSKLDRRTASAGADSSSIERDILKREALEAMRPEDRWVWERRLLGYHVEDIAAELGISAECLSTRITRGIRAVHARLRLRRARE
jgi:hypothetical protein